MTITANDSREEYTASAGQTVFNYTFRIYTADDLNVYVTPAGSACSDADLTTAYVVDTATIDDPAGGFITLNVAASAGDLITINSAITENRTTDYQTNGDFIPVTVNADFDRVVSLLKQIQTIVKRTPSFPECFQGGADISLDPPEPLQFLRWKSDLSGVENVDLASFGAPTTSDLVTYTPSGVGAVASDVQTTLRETISVRGFGAAGDGVTDDTAAIQAAIDYVQSVNSLGGYGYQFTPVLYIPYGRYVVTSELTIDPLKEINFIGAGMTATIFDCSTGAAFRSLITTAASNSKFNHFAEFAIFGGGDIQYGIYAPDTEHTTYHRVRVSGASVAGIYHSAGWSSVFSELELAANGGHGLQIESSGNAAQIISCQIYSNSGFGIWSDQNKSFKVVGGVVEKNAAGGIMCNATFGVDITAYFEDNGATGYTYTTPAQTIKADVILNGSGTPVTTLSPAFPCRAVNIHGQFGSPGASQECVVYGAGVNGFVCDGYVASDAAHSTTMPFFKTSAVTTVADPQNIFIRGLETTNDKTTLLDVEGVGADRNNTWPQTIDISSIPSLNVTDQYGSDPTAWAHIVSGTSDLTMSTHTAQRNGITLYKSVQDIGGSSNIEGFTFALTDIEDYDESYWYAFMMVKPLVGNPGFELYADNGDGTLYKTGGGSALSAGWSLRCIPFKMNGTGTARIGIRQLGGNASDACIWTLPIVAPVGSCSSRFGVTS